MIEIKNLTEDDVGRRVVWHVGAGIENPGQLVAWTGDRLLIAVAQADKKFLRIVEDIDPCQVCWANGLNQRREIHAKLNDENLAATHG